MPKTIDQIQEKDQEYYLQVYRRQPLTLTHGKGSRVWDVDGNEYIDALAGIAVNSTGHCHPTVVKAIQEQAEKLMHISNFYVSGPQAQLSEALCKLSGLDRVFFTNSGAEANETGVKLCRKWGHHHNKGGEIIVMENSFHGRTLGMISAGKKQYQEGFEPLMGGFRIVPFNDVEAIQKAITPQTCAIWIETVQGEGGIRVADPEYMRHVRALCDAENILLFLDEVQCGIGRTGTFFAYENYGIEPDVLALAKAMGSGFPIGAALCKQHVADAMPYGAHGTTYGGNPLACAAGLATISVMHDECLVDKACKHGDWMMRELFDAAMDMREAIQEVRGKGLMIGIELTFPGADVVHLLRERGILANATAGNVIRLVPPLNMPEEDLKTVLHETIRAIQEIHAKHQNS